MPRLVSHTPFIIEPPQILEQQVELMRNCRELASKYAFRELVTDEELISVGQQLWQALAIDEAFDQAHQQAGRYTLPIILQSQQADTQQLPWEILHHPSLGFLAKSELFTFSRRIYAEQTQLTDLQPGPLRVLLFTSLPDDLEAERARLHTEDEQAQVQEALMPWIAKGLVDLDVPDDGRFSSLKHYLHEFQPHVIFLSGHGQFHHQPHEDQPPYGVFLFEQTSGASDPVAESDLAQAFIGCNVQCVVLSACESGKASSDVLNHGLSRQLHQLGIPHVVGMRESILDRAGILFARHFCDAIANRERVDMALQLARAAITLPMQGATWRDTNRTVLTELSLGQWCLPSLLSCQTEQALIDWQFTPKPLAKELFNETLKSISLPSRFVGRRSELHALRSRLRSGEIKQLLITGPGGQGKTALAGKLAQTLETSGYQILAWSAQSESRWSDFVFDLEFMLSDQHKDYYNHKVLQLKDDYHKAKLLLELLLKQTDNRMVVFLDNLESIQHAGTRELEDQTIGEWITAAQALATQGLILLLTSRWQLPNWPEKNSWPLTPAIYGDFLRFAQYQNLPVNFSQQRDRLYRVYQTLHGNFRALSFFAAAMQDMQSDEESQFLDQLAQAEAEIQANMALSMVIKHRSQAEYQLLTKLQVYQTPVPIEGVIKLILDEEQPESLLDVLVAVSLVEKSYTHDLQTHEYQCSPLVSQWLTKQDPTPLPNDLYKTAADYQIYLFDQERRTLNQAMIVHQALLLANANEQAHRFALDYIVGRLNQAGFYQRLLKDWLPAICQADDKKNRTEALGQTGKQHLHLGDYEIALDYLKQSLAIRQEIGDKAGLCATLFNMGHIHLQNEEPAEALQTWLTVYQLAKPMNQADALTALENLASQLGLPGEGLQAWESLLQQHMKKHETEKKTE